MRGIFEAPGHQRGEKLDEEVQSLCPRPSATVPMAGGCFMTTKSDRSRLLHESLGDDARRDLPRVADARSAPVAQRVGERLGEVFGCGGSQVSGLGHAPEDSLGPVNKERTIQRCRSAIRVAVSRPTARPVILATKTATRRQCAGVRPWCVMPSGRLTSRSKVRASR
jgi:hypothetical protein